MEGKIWFNAKPKVKEVESGVKDMPQEANPSVGFMELSLGQRQRKASAASNKRIQNMVTTPKKHLQRERLLGRCLRSTKNS